MDPGIVPECLQNLSQVEEMLIARVCPIMCVYQKHGGQHGYKGHVINFPQDVQGFLDKLPCSVKDLPVLVVRRSGVENTHKDFTVRRDRVLAALQWLKRNNPCYADVGIDMASIADLPIDGVPAGLLSVHEDGDDELASADGSEDNLTNDARSFLPFPMAERTEDAAIRSVINAESAPNGQILGKRLLINRFTAIDSNLRHTK